MATIAELEKTKNDAVDAYESAQIGTRAIACAIVKERRAPSFDDLPHQRAMLDGLLDRLAEAVDTENAAYLAVDAARTALIAAYDRENARSGTGLVLVRP